MKQPTIILTEQDFNLLMRYFLNGGLSSINKRRLYSELMGARIVAKDCLPLNVVCRNSKVVVWNVNKNHTFSVQVDIPELVPEGATETALPIGLALLGYPTGAITEWEMPDGINTFKIISVGQDSMLSTRDTSELQDH
ncbi:transcription elongation factor GreA [Desertivirga xinjiangensis]|uniref:transcription elongation factor GreA n=1 Tax=Desertivirga xinjiangensis TaxID=539206 RepID=UPI00210EBF44|nr:transcription elongation factor GreA [Pedobacter xinjiangensis]